MYSHPNVESIGSAVVMTSASVSADLIRSSVMRIGTRRQHRVQLSDVEKLDFIQLK
jgi:hypothetical protein